MQTKMAKVMGMMHNGATIGVIAKAFEGNDAEAKRWMHGVLVKDGMVIKSKQHKPGQACWYYLTEQGRKMVTLR